VAEVLTGIMDEIRSIMEGSATDTGRAITAGRFKALDVSAGRIGAMAASARPRPFTLEVAGLAAGPGQPANVAGNYVYGSHLLRMLVLYATRRQETYTLLQEIQEDEYEIRRALEWPLAWAEVTGWVGLEIEDASLELVGEDETPDLLALVVDMRVDHREDWG